MRFLLSLLLLGTVLAAQEYTRTDEQGRIVAIPLPIPAEFLNPWPAAYEDGFLTRADRLIRSGKVGGSIALENEKQAYPNSMLGFLNGQRTEALGLLQTADGESPTTDGIDLYWCFTLKGQMRKFFLFGAALDPAYRERMLNAARAWTASDPRPNTELVLQLDSPDPEVAAYAAEALKQMWRSAAQIQEMAAQADADGHPNKKAFAAYMRGVADQIGSQPPTDRDGWLAWWSLLSRGDWQVFEEYDRLVNLRPHPTHGVGKGPVGTDWSPSTRGGVVDWRNTDNLRGMREVSVYLMAEAAGNDLVRRIFKDRLRRTACGFLGVGMGEWDSESYHAHTIGAYVNLYDFAQDPEVRQMGKAILDYLVTAGAVKAWRGGTCGPIKRDYGNIAMWSSHASFMDFWFGTAPVPEPHPHHDLVHAITSTYRPPAAVVAFARREFPLPCEIWSSHPEYSHWLPGRGDAPLYFETTWFARTYQMGSKADGPGYDEAGMKILISSEAGVDFVVPTMQKKGNPCTGGGVQIAQARNCAIWQCKKPDAPVNILLPASAKVDLVDGTAFVQFAGDRTWAAFRPIRTNFSSADAKAVSAYAKEKAKGPPAFQLLVGAATGGGPAGWALELGEQPDHDNYTAFKSAILARNSVTAAAEGATLKASDGRTLGIAVTGGRDPVVSRDGVEHDWKQHWALYQGAAGGPSPVSLGWKEGILKVEAGGHRFEGRIDLKTGIYRSENHLAP